MQDVDRGPRREAFTFITRESAEDTPNNHVHNGRASRDVLVSSGGSRNRADREREWTVSLSQVVEGFSSPRSRQTIPGPPTQVRWVRDGMNDR